MKKAVKEYNPDNNKIEQVNLVIMRIFILGIVLFLSGCNPGFSSDNRNLLQSDSCAKVMSPLQLALCQNKDTLSLCLDTYRDDNKEFLELLPYFKKIDKILVIDSNVETAYLDRLFRILSHTSIRTIILSGERYDSIPQSISEIRTLRNVEITAREVIKDWSALARCENLDSLVLNGIINFPKDPLYLVNLSMFQWRSRIPPIIVPEYLEQFHNLSEIDQGNQKLDEFSKYIYSLNKFKLRRLDLRMNDISKIPADLSGLSNLRYINLCTNPVIMNFKEMKRLQEALPNCYIDLEPSCISWGLQK